MGGRDPEEAVRCWHRDSWQCGQHLATKPSSQQQTRIQVDQRSPSAVVAQVGMVLVFRTLTSMPNSGSELVAGFRVAGSRLPLRLPKNKIAHQLVTTRSNAAHVSAARLNPGLQGQLTIALRQGFCASA